MSRRLALGFAVVVHAFGAAPASAYWAGAGSGIGLASVQSVGAGVQPTVSVDTGSVTVAWVQTPFGMSVLGSFAGGGYTVKRYPLGGGPALTPNSSCGAIVSGIAATLTCVEGGVAPGRWRYTVTPMLNSWSGAEGEPSSPAAVAPPAPVLAPATPRNPAPGEAVGDVELAWSASAGATGYDVYRRTSTGFFDFSAPLNGPVPLSATTFTDPGAGLGATTAYAYVVRAVADTVESPGSNERSATPFARPPAPPSVAAVAAPAAVIDVTWSGVAGVTGYAVYRRTSTGSYDYAAPLQGPALLAAASFADGTALDGGTYHYVVRSFAAGAGGVEIESFDSAETAATTADGGAPTAVTIGDPGSPLRGSVTVSGSASDSGSGIASVSFQHRVAGASAWTEGCVATSAPFSCALDTTAMTDGLHDLRAVATDRAGNTTRSGAVTGRRVDNTAPTVTVADPGAFVRATITLSAAAVDPGSGLASVVVQTAPTGSGSWAAVCSATSSPASCPLNTATLADGGYDLRAIATDAAGNSATSAVLSDRVVDNTAPTGTDVQTANAAGGTAGKPEPGDVLTYIFSEPMSAASVLAGWTGAATPVVVRFTNGNPDVITVHDAANTVQLALGSVGTAKKYVDASTTFTGSTALLSGSAIAITLGTPGGATQAAKGNSALQWTTSTAATDRAGNPLVGAVVAETGAADLDF